ncbi:MAG: hypothetical protein M1820_008072 [Bogoriella megaspora]|nr:MAG: hypothetical protein M1820_008072 [Bogoriella megaspora]
MLHIQNSLRLTLFALLSAPLASAVNVIDTLSFGHKGTISSNGQSIPSWHISGSGGDPQLLSDRVILTPPYPGNRRGALWAESPADYGGDWTAELQFRASGQERGGGNLQLWFAKNGEQAVARSSVYTAGQFDGLVLMLDQYGGRGGSVRGFLNDGTVDYKSHHNVDGLAFGHCDYPYRNLGRFSVLKVEASHHGLRVTVDDKTCFSSDKISLPAGGYYFGITAGSAETPDSFEISKFTVASTRNLPPQQPPQQQQQNQPPPGQQQQQQPQLTSHQPPIDNTADLNARIQALASQADLLNTRIIELTKVLDQRHTALLAQISHSRSNVAESTQLDDVRKRVESIERNVGDIKRDVESKDYREHLQNMQRSIAETREGLMGSLPGMISSSAPRMGFFLFVVIAFQVMLAGSYIVYKRRRANAPKKFL